MKKDLLRFGLSLIALFVMVVANAQTYQNKEASVSWPFNDDNYAMITFSNTLTVKIIYSIIFFRLFGKT